MKAWFLVALTFLPYIAFAAETNTSSAVTLQSFRILAQRNIFDPTRRGGAGQQRRIDPSRLARAEGFSLVGTMVYSNEALAFFNGSDTRYKKVLKVANAIADYKVTEVAANYVKLETNGNEIKLPVGMQMKKIAEGDWQLMEGTTAPAATAEASVNDNREKESNTGNSPDAILKKLMQQREKELNK